MRRRLALCLLAALAAGGALAQEVTLRLHTFLPADSSIPGAAIRPWIEQVEQASGGRLRIEMFGSMQLGGAPASLYDQVRDGVVDMVWTLPGYTPGRFPRSEAFELPFMVTTAEATSRAYQRFIDAHGAAEFADVHPILVHTHGPGVLHVRGAGVARLEDMADLKLRGPTRIVTGLLGDLGATAIGMPVPAVPEALSKGVIDGVAIPWEVSLPLKVAELVDAHTEFEGGRGLYTAAFLMAMNRDSYAALPEDLRAVIDAHSGVEAAAAFGRAADALDVQGRAAAEASGNTIRRLDTAETARWRAASAAAVERWTAEMAARGLDGAALHAQAQRLIDEESAR